LGGDFGVGIDFGDFKTTIFGIGPKETTFFYGGEGGFFTLEEGDFAIDGCYKFSTLETAFNSEFHCYAFYALEVGSYVEVLMGELTIFTFGEGSGLYH